MPERASQLAARALSSNEIAISTLRSMRVRFVESSYSCGIVYAYWDDSWDGFASLTHCPLGVAIRWYFIESGPGANEIAPDMSAAKAIVEQWIRGLDIEPWE